MKIAVFKPGRQKWEVEVGRIPVVGEQIEIPDERMMEVTMVIHLANYGVGEPVAVVRTVLVE